MKNLTLEAEKRNQLFQYNVETKDILRSKEIYDKISLKISHQLEQFLKSSNEMTIDEDPHQLLKILEFWLEGNPINEEDLKIFFDKVVYSFRTRSTEIKRRIILYFSPDMEIYLIHTREDIDIINCEFDEIIRVGLSNENILRAFKFYFREKINEVVIRYKEKSLSKILRKLFRIENKHFDYTSIVKINCHNREKNISYQISMSPKKFVELYDSHKIEIDREIQKVRFPDDWMDISSLKVKNNSYSPDMIDQYIETIKIEYANPIKEQIDK